jgi:hypothetical protein
MNPTSNDSLYDIEGETAEERQRRVNCLEKMTWPTENMAVAAAAYAQWQYSGAGKVKPYRCKYCDKWHLSGS